jgi:leucyl-tRNA synthetase
MNMEFSNIEKKWQEEWERAKIFKVKEDPHKKKYYVLEMFPYPSGKLHMGHVRNYTIGDCFARFKRMNGFNVLYPMGYDAFGLPAENAAIDHNIHPHKWTMEKISEMKAQQLRLGFSYDWSREVITCYPEYYKWNQWIFLKMFKKGLIYRKKAPVNWCPGCETVLANEQVKDGKCWRCESEVVEKELEQWFIKIRDYADRLLDGLKQLDGWPENVRTMQENWIGKSYGVNVLFKIKDFDRFIQIFTTRVDTLYGVTFMVIAPEHPVVYELVKGTEYEKKVMDFVNEVKRKSLIDRTSYGKEGVFTGRYAINPVNGKEVPIYVGDFVIYEYGGGAVMAVPAHDQRDFEFAKQHNLPIIVVIKPKDRDLKEDEMLEAYVENGILVNSGPFNGMDNETAKEKIADFLEEKGLGKRTVEYKLRDWLISRQRYWGTPIPIVYCEKCGIVPVPEKDLPVLLPENVRFTKSGNPLETSQTFLKTKCPNCKGEARRETDTMDTFFDSSWYFLRYCSPETSDKPFDPKKVKYWMPVDQYIGGIEHACMHLIYARFFTKVLKDMGLLDIEEPFSNLLTQGMVIKDGKKMSKSFGNVVDPEDMMNKYGVDTVRLFMLFAASPEKELEWSERGVEGLYRFLKRIFKLFSESKKYIEKGHIDAKRMRNRIFLMKANNTLKIVTESIESFKFNIALSHLMSFFNEVYEYKKDVIDKKPDAEDKIVYTAVLKKFLLMLAPFAPHTAEELWHEIGEKTFISIEKWPKFEKKLCDPLLEATEFIKKQIIEDIESIINILKIKKVREIKLYVSEDWKYDLYKKAKEELERSKDPGKIIRALLDYKDFSARIKFISKFVPMIIKNPEKIPKFILSQEEEFKILNEISKDIGDKFGAKVVVQKADGSNFAEKASPSKPGIEIV